MLHHSPVAFQTICLGLHAAIGKHAMPANDLHKGEMQQHNAHINTK